MAQVPDSRSDADDATTPQSDADFKFLWTNTFLFDGVTGFKSSAPDQAARAKELGGRVEQEDFDVAAFCEVFDPEDRERILEPMTGAPRSETGPEGHGLQTSSGLHTVARNLRDNTVTAVDQHEFEAGSPFTAKGVLYLQVDLGEIAIDIFSTHTYIDIGLEDGSLSKEASYYRRQQLEELVYFVEDMKEEHDSEQNPTIVCGDFNLAAHTDEYENVEWMMDELDLYDAWVEHQGGFGATWKAREGHEYEGGDMYSICNFDPESGPPYYCTYTDVQEGERLDYVLIGEGAASFDVELVRRRPWYRSSETDSGEPNTDYWQSGAHQKPNYLSDHMGLEVQFSLPEK